MKETRFKRTEIGLIPEDWETITLGQVGDVKMCKRIFKSQTLEKGDIPFFKIGTFGKEPDAYISKSLFEEYKEKYNYPSKGDLLISAAGTIGRVVEFDGKDAYFQDSNIIWIANNEKYVTNSFLKYVYRIVKWVTEDGGIVTRLYNNNVRASSFGIPKDIDEQKHIAEALGEVDKLLSSLEQLIEKKRMIKQGAMQRLLTGKLRLSGFNKPWVEKSIGKHCSVKARIGWQGLKSDEYLNNGDYFLVGGTDFKDGRVDWANCKYVSKMRFDQDKNIQLKLYDCLISKDGTIGKVAFIDSLEGNGTLNSGVFVVRSKDKKLDQSFLSWIFLSPVFNTFIKELVAGSTIMHLYQKDIVKFSFLVPSDLDEQRAISKILTDMDAEIAALEAKLNKYKDIKSGMMQQLLTGKIRLR